MNWKNFLPYIMLFLMGLIVVYAVLVFGVIGGVYLLMEVFNLGC